MPKTTFSKTVHQSLIAYYHNWKLLALFSIPFLIAFPLSMLLPNYISLSAIFLRPDTIGNQASISVLGITAVVSLIAILLYSFSLAAVNVVVKSQRTMVKLKNLDFELVEEATFRIFGVMLVLFALIFSFTLLFLRIDPNGSTWSLLLRAAFMFVVSLAALFAPQAIVIDRASVENSLALSYKIVKNKSSFTIGLLAITFGLIGINTVIFDGLTNYVFFASLLGLAVNALVISPFLEVLKVQIFLSKYTLL